MSLQPWFSFIAATTVLLLIPGPTVLQCIGDSLANRNRQNWGTILGVGVGDTIAMSLSLLGAGALLKTSAAAFAIMKTIGGVYLLYLGFRAIREARITGNAVTPQPTKPESALRRFSKTSTITMLNPKSILYVARRSPLEPPAKQIRTEEGQLRNRRRPAHRGNPHPRLETALTHYSNSATNRS